MAPAPVTASPISKADAAKQAEERKGKLAASGAFAVSILVGLLLMSPPWSLIPPVVAALCLSWLWTRPEA